MCNGSNRYDNATKESYQHNQRGLYVMEGLELIHCSNCDKTFDEKRIIGICPYCGTEKGLIVKLPSVEEEWPNTIGKLKTVVHSSNTIAFPIASILLGSLNVFWPSFIFSGLGLFMGIKGLQTFHKNLAIIGIFICSLGLIINVVNHIDDFEKERSLHMLNIAASNFDGISGVSYRGDYESVVVVIDAEDLDFRTEGRLKSLLKQLGFSSAVLSRMYHTRAIDGTQNATGEHANATWTYHPDSGLRIVFELNR